MTTGATDLTLYCGDFNTEPSTVVYRLLNCIVPLKDAWVEHTGEDFGGETCETAQNSFTIPGSKSKRIDYIMYRPGPSVEAETVNCWLPLPNKVPQQNFSYSDHEAVAAIFKVKKSIHFCRLDMNQLNLKKKIYISTNLIVINCI